MRIVVDTALNTGAAEYANLGDVAMLQVGVKRLQALWPAARIDVLTDSPKNLALFCPGATPLPRVGRDFWVGDNYILGKVARILPGAVANCVSEWSRAMRLRCPELFRRLAKGRFAIRDRGNVMPQIDAFVEAMNDADLFVVCGAGGFTDSSRAWNMSTLNTMEEAFQRKVPGVMFGQGMGPLSDSKVRRRAREILPKVSLFSLRGSRGGKELAESLGLNPALLSVTGDEAVELAFEAKAREAGEGVGVNLRLAFYSNVDDNVMDKLRTVMHEFARRHDVPLIPVPIAFHAWANDHVSIQKLLQGFDDHSDGGIKLDTPIKVIRQVGRCRIVVTGAYHAGVFALSQGIPVVGLSASADYSSKFLGLKDQFGVGCETVFLNAANVSERLAAAMEMSWQSAEDVRLPLQRAARRQIELSRRAYDKTKDLVSPAEVGETSPGRRL